MRQIPCVLGFGKGSRGRRPIVVGRSKVEQWLDLGGDQLRSATHGGEGLLGVLAVWVSLSASCQEKPAGEDSLAVLRLHELLVSTKRDVYFERLAGEVLWTDKAILERAKVFPHAIQALLDRPRPDGGPKDGSMAALLQELELRRSEWRPGAVHRRGSADLDCDIGEDEVKANVNCIYVNYLQARYRDGRFLAKAPLEPVLFIDGQILRAALMPVKQ